MTPLLNPKDSTKIAIPIEMKEKGVFVHVDECQREKGRKRERGRDREREIVRERERGRERDVYISAAPSGCMLRAYG